MENPEKSDSPPVIEKKKGGRPRNPPGMKTYKRTIRIMNPITGKDMIEHISASSVDDANRKAAQVRHQLQLERDLMLEEHQRKLIERSIPEKRFELTLPSNGGVSVGLLGASRSGKTSVLKYIYKKYFQRRIAVMTTLSGQNDIYKNMSKKLIVDNEFHPEVLREMYLINHGTDNKYRFLYIMDDYNGGKSKTDTEMTRALTIYRNSFIDFIYANQDPTLMSSTGRGNLNYICLFHFNTPQVIEKVVKMFLISYFPTDFKMAEKIQLYDKLTKDHHFFLLDNLNGTIHLCKLTDDQLACEDSSDENE